MLVAVLALHGMLAASGCRVVFFDDLLRQRTIGLSAATQRAIRGQLDELDLADILIDADTHPDLVIWGAGWQARSCLERAAFFKRRRPAFLVDSTPAKIGSDFMGFPVHDPRALLGCAHPVLIAAVQGTPAIYDAFLRLGLPPSRLVTKIVI
jgi:FlaA1/EpsC-like NDP-sugar epimerase